MKKRITYKYTIELSKPVFPRHLADMLTDRFLINHLISVKDEQRNDHIYGDTYQAGEDEQTPSQEEQP